MGEGSAASRRQDSVPAVGDPHDTPVLRVVNLTKRFGGLAAVDNLDLAVRQGATHCIIGPNGAGKSTFDLVTNVQPATSGDVYFFGERITGLPPIAARSRYRAQIPGADTLSRVDRRGEPLPGQGRSSGMEPAAADEGHAGRRCGGGRTARAPAVGGTGEHPGGHPVPWPAAVVGDRGGLMARPRLLLLDEPTAGMSPRETEATAERCAN